MSPDRGAQPKTAAPAAFPTGEVTFLFSDIEGSTRRWEVHAEAMKAAVARHEQIVNAAIAQHGGFVFKGMGDAVFAAFPFPPHAIRAAIHAPQTPAPEKFFRAGGR